jgi:hypothetical protein
LTDLQELALWVVLWFAPQHELNLVDPLHATCYHVKAWNWQDTHHTAWGIDFTKYQHGKRKAVSISYRKWNTHPLEQPSRIETGDLCQED